MAKRIQVGSIMKGKENKGDYIKITEDVTLKKGDFLNLENKASKIASLNAAIESGKLSQEVGQKLLENAEKMPDFVRFEITKST